MTSIQTLFADCMAIKQFADIVNPVINRTNSAYCINKHFEENKTNTHYYLLGHTILYMFVGITEKMRTIRSKNTKEFRDICLTKKGKEKPNNVKRWEKLIGKSWVSNKICPRRWGYNWTFEQFQDNNPHYERFPHKEPMSHQWNQEMGYSIRALLDSCKSQKAFDKEIERVSDTLFCPSVDNLAINQ